jgi:hypothetical protein
MNVDLKIQASEIKDDVEWSKEESFDGDSNTYLSSSRIVETVEHLVIIEEGSCVSMPEWDDVVAHEYLVAITKSGKKIRLLEIERT